MSNLEKKTIPNILKGYNYEVFKKEASSDLHEILNFFSNGNFTIKGIERSELLNEITTECMVIYLTSKGYKEIPSKNTGKKHNGGWTAIYRYFIEQEGDDEDEAIGVIDYNNPHNKGASAIYIEQFIKEISITEDRSEIDVLLELLSLLPKDKK